MSKLVGRRLKEDPKDAKTVSHKFLLRGGYARSVSTGIYSLLPLGKRVISKIEAIIREEMNRIDGQEVEMPVVLPADLWMESGRYDSVGEELLRFKDRNDKPMVLAMTHEEAVVQLARTELTSYKQLPAMLYQIQTKYRDEARPRAGLIRVREFTMKDAYSFHTAQDDLEKYYDRAHESYDRIFKRLGMKNFISILSNSGMMGGKISHEFMALCDCGEDTICVSRDRKYRANREVASADWKFEKSEPLPLEKVATPDAATIEDVAAFLGVDRAATGKAVFYQNAITGELIFALIRGDFEVNEAKLQNAVKAPELKFADAESIREIGCEPGYASILAIDPSKVKIVIDRSAAESSNLVVGANEPGFHCRNFNLERDFPRWNETVITDIATVRDGDPCLLDGSPLELVRGIEIGNIFQLGVRYSEAMNCRYLDENGQSHPMVMGCYGIGVGRAMAAVMESSHDDFGPIWPVSIAPYQAHVVALLPGKDGCGEAAEKLVDELESLGVEVLYDDRGEKAGFMFNDADLIGIPFRLVVSPRTLADGEVEFKVRGGGEAVRLKLAEAAGAIKKEIAAAFAALEP
ncbi:MAG: proline--tRNA ligase [Victivallaceae bacterium]